MSASKRQRQSFQGNLPRKLERIFEKMDRDIDNARIDGKHSPERQGLNPSSISENSTGTMWTF
jgi:hypothetical protein